MRAFVALGIEAAEALITALLTAVSALLPVPFDAIFLWLLWPAAALFIAYRSVRRGLNNYIAWLIPPACYFAGHMIVWGFSPPAGAALLAAFTALVGSAAGYVRNTTGSQSSPGRHRKG